MNNTKYIPINNPKLDEKEGFTTKNDVFEYKPFGEKLINFFVTENDPTVIMLTGEWGSGKTIFRQQIASEIRKLNTMDVLEFDAFTNDYMQNAFVAITSELSDSDKKFDAIKENAIKTTKVLTKLTGGINADEVIDTIFNNRKDDKETLNSFRRKLEQSVGERKLLIIVDELDRCRPDFALSVLETIKHFFHIPNIHFLLITNENQLCNSIQHCYGGDEKQARDYLEKFYDIRLRLPFNREKKKRQVEKYLITFLEEHTPFESPIILAEQFAPLILEQKLSLRELSKHLKVASFTISTLKGRAFQADYALPFAQLTLVRIARPDLYESLLTEISNHSSKNSDNSLKTLQKIQDFLGDKEFLMQEPATLGGIPNEPITTQNPNTCLITELCNHINEDSNL